jgi:hypothetical protein
MHFAEKHGERIMAELGMAHDPNWEPDLTGFKASFGLEPDVEGLTHRELLERRQRIRENLQKREARAGRRR